MSRKRKGSSLVLIIFIVLTLVMFGVTQLLISWNSYKISMKTASWTQSYYNTEAKAQRFVSQLDSLTRSRDVSMESIKDFVAGYSESQDTIASSCNGIGISKASSLKSPCVLDVYFFNESNIRDFLVKIAIDLNGRPRAKVISWKKLPTHFEYKEDGDQFDMVGGDEPAFGEGGISPEEFDSDMPISPGEDEIVLENSLDSSNDDGSNDSSKADSNEIEVIRDEDGFPAG